MYKQANLLNYWMGVLPKSLDSIGGSIAKGSKFAVKHPVISSGGIAGLYGASSLGRKVKTFENKLNMERSHVMGTKFAGVYTHMSKIADNDNRPGYVAQGMQKELGKSIITRGLDYIRQLVGMGAQHIHEQQTMRPQREAIFKVVTTQDPVVSQYMGSAESARNMRSAYDTMQNIAPTLSTDPNVVRSFMRNAAMTDGVMDFPTVQGLANAERSVHQARGAYSWGNDRY